MKQASVEDFNLFMMCPALNPSALRPLPEGYTVRFCREQELDFWMTFHFDTKEEGAAYLEDMKRFFQQVYAPAGGLFFRSCQFLCDPQGRPVGTCFLWKAYGTLSTVHWFKVRKDQEGKGLGRALLSHVLRFLPQKSILYTCIPNQAAFEPLSCTLILAFSCFPALERSAFGRISWNNPFPI